MPGRWLVADRLAATAAVVADPTRARILELLMDGRAWTVGEIARAVGISAPAATGQGHHLVATGWCDELRQGRHRYLRLATAEHAALLETLGQASSDAAPEPTSLRQVRADAALHRGRTCYQHLAGALGLAVAAGWRRLGVVEGEPTPIWTRAGDQWLAELNLETGWSYAKPVVRPCLDWTHRVPHYAGQAPDHFCTALLARGWLRRGDPPRAVALTDQGRGALEQMGLPDLP